MVTMMNISGPSVKELDTALHALRDQGIPFFDRCPFWTTILSSKRMLTLLKISGTRQIIVRERDVAMVRLIVPNSAVLW
ncbi:MAG: hypothetical protein EOO77_23345, partial [Oxalobacteraceae bacterium]